MSDVKRASWKVLTFRMRVRSTEFEVLADALAGELENSARMIHGCRGVEFVTTRVNGKLVDFRRKGKKPNAD
jgi:hypothetical protein